MPSSDLLWNEFQIDDAVVADLLGEDDQAHPPPSASVSPSGPTTSVDPKDIASSSKAVRPSQASPSAALAPSGSGGSPVGLFPPALTFSESDSTDDDPIPSAAEPLGRTGSGGSVGRPSRLTRSQPSQSRSPLRPVRGRSSAGGRDVVSPDRADDSARVAGPSIQRGSSLALPSGPFADAIGGRRPATFPDLRARASAPAGAPLAGSLPSSSSSSSSRTVTPEEDQAAPAPGPSARTSWFDDFLTRPREAPTFPSRNGSAGSSTAGPSVAGMFSTAPREALNAFGSSSSSSTLSAALSAPLLPVSPARTAAVTAKVAPNPSAIPFASQESAASPSAKAKGKGKEKAAWIEEDDLSCAICQDIYVGSSSVVPCGHSFCGQCIWDYIKAKNDTCPICRAQLPLIGTKIIPNYALEEVICRWAEATLDEDARKEWMSRKDGWLAYKLALEDENKLAASRATAGRVPSLYGGGGRGEASIGRRLAEYAPNFYDRPQGAAAAQRPMFDAVSRGLGERYRAVDDARIMQEAVRAAYADEPQEEDRYRYLRQAVSSDDDEEEDLDALRRSLRRSAQLPPRRTVAEPDRPLPSFRRRLPPPAVPAVAPPPARPQRSMFARPPPPPRPSFADRPPTPPSRSSADFAGLSPRSRRRRAVLGSSPPHLIPPPPPAPVAGPSGIRLRMGAAAAERAAAFRAAGGSANAGPASARAAAGERPVAPLPSRRSRTSGREGGDIDVVDLISD